MTDVKFIGIVPESGPCPKCDGRARYQLVDFDNRMVKVSCRKCGPFQISKRHLDNRVAQLRHESIEVDPQRA